MKKRRNGRNDKGYTLVELIIAIAILSIIVGAVMGFFMYIIKAYHKGTAESDLQNEAQLTMTHLETLVVNASQGIGLDPSLPESTTKGDEMYVYNRFEDGGAVSYQVTHIFVADNKLKYCYMNYSNDGSGNYGLSAEDKDNAEVLSDYVENFSVDVSQLVSNNRVGFSIDFKAKGDREYKTDNTVLLRNKVLDKTNGNAADYFADAIEEDKKSEVTRVEVSPKEFSMWAGTSAANPFSVTFYKADNTVSNRGTAVWMFDGNYTNADINRATGAIKLGSDISGDLTVQAIDQGSITRAGMDSTKYVLDTATIHVKTASATASLTTPVQKKEDMTTAVATFTIYGENFTEADLGMISPSVMADSSVLSVSITPDVEGSDFTTGKLCYTVKVKRPANYLGKTYTLGIHAMVPGNKECVAAPLSFKFVSVEGEDDKEISAVKIESTNGEFSVEGSGAAGSANMDRGDDVTLIMYVRYKDENGVESEFTPLPAEAWAITPVNDKPVPSASTSIVAGQADYTVYMNAQDYNKTYSMDFTTTYSNGKGEEAQGPSIHFTFNKVTFAVKNLVGKQKVFPVTAGKTSYIYFEVDGLKHSTVFVQKGSGAGLSVVANGDYASVAATQNASMDVDFTFGLRDGKGKTLEGVTCDLTIWPDRANTATSNGGALNDPVYIPSVTDISNFDSSQSAPVEGRTSTIFMPDGNKITYTNSNRKAVDGSTYRYWAEYNGKTYYYVQSARQWRLNEN